MSKRLSRLALEALVYLAVVLAFIGGSIAISHWWVQ
jgi:hypothetical protein